MLRGAPLVWCGTEASKGTRACVVCGSHGYFAAISRVEGGERGDKAEHLSSFYGFTFYIR